MATITLETTLEGAMATGGRAQASLPSPTLPPCFKIGRDSGDDAWRGVVAKGPAPVYPISLSLYVSLFFFSMFRNAGGGGGTDRASSPLAGHCLSRRGLQTLATTSGKAMAAIAW
ncbi:hypothetical protein CDL15_Pgr007918 [Punica granatum]|uniref:Uncharacterized protein n=1 Tax=Punica granatum TaxID=22663 RepID=A0A218XAZ2_PUNGR|nr:hypothetical protein CDL15_Pgr007918 [Punica granatum]